MNRDKIRAIKTARAWLRKRPMYLDTETTGLSADDHVIDLALIDHNGTVLIDTLIRPIPQVKISQIASEIHGITNEDIVDAPTFPDVLINLTRLTKGRLVLIYNATFDLRLMQQSISDWKVDDLPYINAACVMQLYAEFHGQKQKLGQAAFNFGVVGCDLHRASVDAQLCRQIVEAMAATLLPGEEG